MGDLVECYKCFSIGPHNCYQNFNAEKEFVCENCGNLKSPFQFEIDQNNNLVVACLWCTKTLKEHDLAQYQHILWCPERKVPTFGDFFRYHCICAQVKAQEKWKLYN